MPTPSRPDDSGQPTAEDLNRGTLATEVSRPVALAVTGLFVLFLALVPAAQVGIELFQGRTPQALALFSRAPTGEHLRAYEKDLEDQSAARRAVQPCLQELFSRHLGFGNANVVVGRDGWLFYRPGVDFLTGPGFLDPARLRQRGRELLDAGEKNPGPDPRPAILAFHEACRRAGAVLVVVPVPDKAMIQAGELTARLAPPGPRAVPANVDYPRFLAELRAAGVDVFDPSPAVVGPGEEPRFLRQDSHWTPRWMEAVARDLADHVRGRVTFGSPGRAWSARPAAAARVGDLVDLLRLPAGQTTFPPLEVGLHRVVDPRDGSPWRPRADADVLLLGDSFSNIYVAGGMGWGTPQASRPTSPSPWGGTWTRSC